MILFLVELVAGAMIAPMVLDIVTCFFERSKAGAIDFMAYTIPRNAFYVVATLAVASLSFCNMFSNRKGCNYCVLTNNSDYNLHPEGVDRLVENYISTPCFPSTTCSPTASRLWDCAYFYKAINPFGMQIWHKYCHYTTWLMKNSGAGA